jgi:hypothetical protein
MSNRLEEHLFTVVITPEQCRAARILAKIGRTALAARTNIGPSDATVEVLSRQLAPTA